MTPTIKQRSPRTLTVRDNVPHGARVVMTPAAAKNLVRLFGDEALRRAAEEKANAAP